MSRAMAAGLKSRGPGCVSGHKEECTHPQTQHAQLQSMHGVELLYTGDNFSIQLTPLWNLEQHSRLY